MLQNIRFFCLVVIGYSLAKFYQNHIKLSHRYFSSNARKITLTLHSALCILHFLCSAFCTLHLILRFLPYTEYSDENGTENAVHKYFNDEVCEGEGDKYAESRAVVSDDLTDSFGIGHKEDRASEKEDSRVHDRAGKGCEDRGEVSELLE